MRVPLRGLPRRQFGLLPVLARAVVVSKRAEVHARLAQRPHCRARRATDPSLRARPQQRLVYRTLRRTTLAAPRFKLDGDQFPSFVLATLREGEPGRTEAYHWKRDVPSRRRSSPRSLEGRWCAAFPHDTSAARRAWPMDGQRRRRLCQRKPKPHAANRPRRGDLYA
jgi:hypothetical protein